MYSYRLFADYFQFYLQGAGWLIELIAPSHNVAGFGSVDAATQIFMRKPDGATFRPAAAPV